MIKLTLNFGHAKALPLALVLLLLVVPNLVLSQAPLVSPESVGVSSQRLELIDSMLQQHVHDGRVPGLVAGVSRHGQLVFLKSYGWQDIENKLPMQEDSIFQIRSMSKPITAVAVLQLIDQGKLKLCDPVANYIPSFAAVRVFNNPETQDLNDTRSPKRAIYQDEPE